MKGAQTQTERGIRTPLENTLKVAGSMQRGAESAALVVNDIELTLLIRAWATLSQPIKAGILAMVRASDE